MIPGSDVFMPFVVNAFALSKNTNSVGQAGQLGGAEGAGESGTRERGRSRERGIPFPGHP